MRTKKENFWAIIKDAIKQIVKAEGRLEGKINFIFGFFNFILAFFLCVPSVAQIIIKFFYPEIRDGLPIYAIILIYFLLIYYFCYCIHKIMEIQKIRDEF